MSGSSKYYLALICCLTVGAIGLPLPAQQAQSKASPGKLPTSWDTGFRVEKHGWSVKKMHRLIMSSQTYQLASDDVAENTAVDPGNDLVWRANRHRLDAEQIRDAILFFSGQLDLAPGGQHPFPHRLTYFFRQHEPFVANFTARRRTVYEVRQRIRKNDFLDLFDAPDGNLHTGNRKTTTTTLQALYFMNSAFSAKQSAAMAARLMKAESALSDRVKWAYRTVFGRMPTPEEVAAAGDYLAKASSVLESTSDAALQQTVWAGYLRGMISSNEFMFVD